jgi:histidinol-phosphate aminotransferase
MSAAIPSFCDLAVPGVQRLQPYQPGKPIEELEREYGVSDIVKLASNENALGPSPKALAAARDALAEMHRYPDGSAYGLRQALARHHDVAPAAITLGAGSNDVLDLIARAFLGPGREAVFSAHAFAVYPISTLATGATPVEAPANPPEHSQPYGHDLQAMHAAIGERTRVVFVANPNNPTGNWLSMAEIERFLADVPPQVVVVLDEAYVEYAAGAPDYQEGSALLRRYPNLIVTRTFSKAYALAGLRVGYGLSSPELADLLNRVRLPFNVNIPAQAAAVAALADAEHVARSVRQNAEGMEQLQRGLKALGLRWLPSAANFLCVQVGARAADVYEGLLRRGVIVRPVAGYKLPSFLRVSIGLPREIDKLLAALKELQQQGLVQAS